MIDALMIDMKKVFYADTDSSCLDKQVGQFWKKWIYMGRNRFGEYLIQMIVV